ncbi:hypothetical protein GGS26DRAFT_592936 [Hypomontagnella submonticulosa]|nr:hypothetical protein GGS26DRAFT_592936 [Hypomontagnella submonticulosa]
MKEGRTLRPFVSSILRDAKALELPLRNQLEYAFEALDWRIQAQLKKPTAETTLEKFMEQLDNREKVDDVTKNYLKMGQQHVSKQTSRQIIAVESTPRIGVSGTIYGLFSG